MTDRSLTDKVFDFTVENSLFQAPCRVLLGLSGGADSMALLHCLLEWPCPGLEIHAVHVHHGLRGEEADRDEQFVRDHCAALGVPLTVHHVQIAGEAEKSGETLEEAGRRVRYRLFAQSAAAVNAQVIVTAHTADDQTETVLMHLIRGSGVDGLAGIPAKRGNIVRPLLGCTRAEIEDFCTQQGIAYVTDTTNAETVYTRNRVRHELLPLLREFNPAVDAAVRRLAAHASQDSQCLRLLARAALSDAELASGSFAVNAFTDAPQSVRRRMIMALLADGGCYDVEEKHITAIDAALLSGSGGVTLPGGKRVGVCAGAVGFVDETAVERIEDVIPVDLNCLPQQMRFGDISFRLFMLNKTEWEHYQNVHKMFFKYTIDCDRIQNDLFIRSRREGDRIHPAGRHVGKTLKKLMNEQGLPPTQRDAYPLLCDDDGVLLIPGYCCDERVCTNAGTKHFLVWELCSE